ncbi:glycosyltransferase family 2 protein [Parasediminibacterium sp. JCM 36343]|uniref:glycosyltransferase family 2 protein n=1 Tax=Parasediminibacterium sp. JCM 36343 TaxID=3374279 RepID=UPI00397A760C
MLNPIMTSLPLVSVIMPLYNAENYVAEAIQSILNQTYTNWELIIVNDGSTDTSLASAKQFENEKIKVFSKENNGAGAARNYGYKQSKGQFIKFFDADDMLNPGMLDAQVQLAGKNTNAVISGKWGRFYNDNINDFKLSPEACWQDMAPLEWLCSSWYNGTAMTQPGIFLIPKAIIEKAGLWDESLNLVDDLEFFTKIILASQGVKFCDASVLYYRSGQGNNLSGQKSRKAIESYFKAMELSTSYLLAASQAGIVKLTVANVWQSFAYYCYPNNLDLVKKAEKRALNLAKANLPYSNNKRHQFFISIFGWKLLKRFQMARKAF